MKYIVQLGDNDNSYVLNSRFYLSSLSYFTGSLSLPSSYSDYSLKDDEKKLFYILQF